MMDLKEIEKKLQSGEMSTNEARRECDLPPIEGGDQKITKVQLGKQLVPDFPDH